jgi:hypothetical protein
MPAEAINAKIKEMSRMSPEEVKDALPLTLDEIGKYGIGRALEEVPDLLWRIIEELVEIGAARSLSEVPEASGKFMDLLWEGVGGRVLKSQELRPVLESESLMSVLERTGELHVNIEASDSPLRGHFTMSQRKLSGGSGLLHVKDQDFRFFGPTEVLLEFLKGELTLGFSDPNLQTDGHPGLAPSVALIIQGLSKLIKGK